MPGDDTLLLLASPNGQLDCFSVGQNDITRIGSHEAERDETSMQNNPCVGLMCMSKCVTEDNGQIVTFSRVGTQTESSELENGLSEWYAFRSNGQFDAIRSSVGSETTKKQISKDTLCWNLQQLHAVHSINLKTSQGCPMDGEYILSLEKDPLELRVWAPDADEPVCTFHTELRVSRLLKSCVFYVDSTQESDHEESSKETTLHYSPLVCIGTSQSFLGVLCPQKQKIQWSARKTFIFQNLSVPLRVVTFCLIPQRSKEENHRTGVAQKDAFLLCCITEDRFLLVYQPLQRSSPIAVIRMGSLRGEPKCICYGGKLSVLVADNGGNLILVNIATALEKFTGDKAVEWSQDMSFTSVLQRKGQFGTAWIAPLLQMTPSDTQTNNSTLREEYEINSGWLDYVPTHVVDFFPYFLVHGLDGSVQLLAQWNSMNGEGERIRSVWTYSLPYHAPMTSVGWCLPSKRTNAYAPCEVQRFLASRQPGQSIDEFIQANPKLVKALLGWSTLEVCQEV
ncbi:hypothetical protein XU18_0442 [Perkinsela sp. CCAP 1560/4]|nr:hypothetical protein XU18_0442 [Perkinsela sp. CCAP 1560/4]|eukprot:KNH09757.1 hypothetical protein XU18_0442 [Perkinsela sp. CCAP 1560/4]